jgi:hypothetical protein
VVCHLVALERDRFSARAEADDARLLCEGEGVSLLRLGLREQLTTEMTNQLERCLALCDSQCPREPLTFIAGQPPQARVLARPDHPEHANPFTQMSAAHSEGRFRVRPCISATAACGVARRRRMESRRRRRRLRRNRQPKGCLGSRDRSGHTAVRWAPRAARPRITVGVLPTPTNCRRHLTAKHVQSLRQSCPNS